MVDVETSLSDYLQIFLDSKNLKGSKKKSIKAYRWQDTSDHAYRRW